MKLKLTKKLLSLLLVTGFFATTAIAAEVYKLADTTKAWNGSALPKLNIKMPEVKILRIVIKAGEKLPMHKHPVINAGYLTKGKLTVKTEKGKVLNLSAGDSIVEVVNQWHYGENTTNKDAEIVVFYLAEKGQAVTIKK